MGQDIYQQLNGLLSGGGLADPSAQGQQPLSTTPLGSAGTPDPLAPILEPAAPPSPGPSVDPGPIQAAGLGGPGPLAALRNLPGIANVGGPVAPMMPTDPSLMAQAKPPGGMAGTSPLAPGGVPDLGPSSPFTAAPASFDYGQIMQRAPQIMRRYGMME